MVLVDEFQDSYGLLNLRIRYAPSSQNWGVEAFGENILEFIKPQTGRIHADFRQIGAPTINP